MPVAEAIRSDLPPVINYTIGPDREFHGIEFSTGSEDKVRELRSAGIPVVAKDLHVREMQSLDAREVVAEKAREAYIKNGGRPIIVEDTSFEIDARDGRPGPYAKDFLGTRELRKQWCEWIPKKDRGATFRVLLAIYDGHEVQIREGVTRGQLADKPRGRRDFSFDDIFIPDGQKHKKGKKHEPRTYGEMTLVEKNQTSARQRALQELLLHPFTARMDGGENIIQIDEPYDTQLKRIRKELLAQYPNALNFAFSLEGLQKAGVVPNADLQVGDYAPFSRVEMGLDGSIVQYTIDPDSASQGLLVFREIDLKTRADRHGVQQPVRFDVALSGDPVLMQMGPHAMEIALATRATEFMRMHSKEMHQHILDLISGKIAHVPRQNQRSSVMERMLDMNVITDEAGAHTVISEAGRAVATNEIGYKRLSTDKKVSRKKAGLTGSIIMSGDIPSSIYSLGGMPPVTGSRDVLVESALSYMRSWIPHNGIFASDFDRQLKLFEQARDEINRQTLDDRPKVDRVIKDVCIAQIGVSVGSEDPAKIADQARKLWQVGGKAMRIYTTNPGPGVGDVARAIHQAVPEMMICVGPVTDVEQAKNLRQDGVKMFLIGHGGGENCTSLEGGGAANSLELLYKMNLDREFNDCILGVEGGVGTAIGAILPMVDTISLNRRGVGGVELTQGVFMRYKDGQPALTYLGSAGAQTNLEESDQDEEVAVKRLGPDGKVINVEGKSGVMFQEDKINSCGDKNRANRAYIGLALADQQSRSIYELRERVGLVGHNHVEISGDANLIGRDHRGSGNGRH